MPFSKLVSVEWMPSESLKMAIAVVKTDYLDYLLAITNNQVYLVDISKSLDFFTFQ